ncbi:MAG: hypothetical protein ABH878_06300 [bacterium]
MANTGQILLVLGALVLFALMLPSLNQSILHNDRTLVFTNSELTAMSLAQKIIDEAGSKVFDEVCLTTNPMLPSEMTTLGSLGPESGENYPNFDDLDDYNNLALADSLTLPSVRFNIAATISYVNSVNPTQPVGSQTFFKYLQVTVTGPNYISNPNNNAPLQITLSQLFSFF